MLLPNQGQLSDRRRHRFLKGGGSPEGFTLSLRPSARHPWDRPAASYLPTALPGPVSVRQSLHRVGGVPSDSRSTSSRRTRRNGSVRGSVPRPTTALTQPERHPAQEGLAPHAERDQTLLGRGVAPPPAESNAKSAEIAANPRASASFWAPVPRELLGEEVPKRAGAV